MIIYIGLSESCTAECHIFLQNHTKGIFLLHLWLLNPVGGEEHSKEMMHSTEVNLLLHSFRTDPEHFERKNINSVNCKQQPGSCTISSYSFFYLFSFPEDKKIGVSQGIITGVSKPVNSRAESFMEK